MPTEKHFPPFFWRRSWSLHPHFLSTCPRSAPERTTVLFARIILLFALLGTFTISAISQESSSSNTPSPTYLRATSVEPAEEIQPSTRIEVTRKSKRRRWDKTFWSLWIPAIALGAVDVGTTQACLRHPNCREGNPLFGHRPSPWVLYTAKAGSLGLGFAISRNLRSHGSKSWLLFPIIALGEGSFAAINNSIVLSRQPSLSNKSQTRSASLFNASSYNGSWNCQICVKTPRLTHGIQTSKELDFTGSAAPLKLSYELIPHEPR